nr:putative reverse transcriptase domain-containing protein [Tanacetum cinerariifolium]
MPLEGIHVDDTLQFVEEPIEIMEWEIKRFKQSRIPLVKVRWNSKRGPEFTWEREDSFRKKYPHLFTNRASSSTASNETAKDLWDALERQMRGSEYGEQDRKATILYEYETFKANEGEQLLDTYLRYL